MANHLIEEKDNNYVQGIGKLQFDEAKTRVTAVIDGRTYADIDPKTLPDGLISGQDYSIRLDSAGVEIFSVRPLKCSVVLEFDRFSAKKDEPPMPKVQKGGPREYEGKKYIAKDKLVFTAIFKIISKTYKGLEIPYVMDYTFKQWENSNETAIPFGSKNKAKTLDFLRLAGWNEETDIIPWSENVLPFLEKLLVPCKKPLLAAIDDKGWVTSLSPFSPDLMV
jgi:hypothetical protein